MITFIIFVVVIVFGFLFRKKIGTLLLLLVKRTKTPQIIEKQETNFSVLSPVGTVRTFNFSIQIEELGEGKIKVGFIKDKEKTI